MSLHALSHAGPPGSARAADARPRAARWRRSLLALAAGLLPACSPGGGDPVTPTPNPTPGSLAVALSSNSGSVVAGSQVTLTTTVTRGGSFTGVVTMAAEGAPSGVTASFSASSLAAGVSSAGLTLQVGSGVAAGTYPITVRATGTGVSAATATYALTVTSAAVPTFTLAAAPTTVSVTAGQQGTSTLTITRSSGFTGTVNLTATGAPTGVTATFAPAAVTGTTSTVTLAVAASTAAGTYPITIRGAGIVGGRERDHRLGGAGTSVRRDHVHADARRRPHRQRHDGARECASRSDGHVHAESGDGHDVATRGQCGRHGRCRDLRVDGARHGGIGERHGAAVADGHRRLGG